MASLDHLDPLVGEWRIEIPPNRHMDQAVGGTATYEWLGDRGFLVNRSTVDHPLFPDGVTIIGGDPVQQHYFDSRGVQRVYDFELRDGRLRIERHDPDFWQRSVATFSEDGTRLEMRIEFSNDEGATWEHDFDIVYVKVS